MKEEREVIYYYHALLSLVKEEREIIYYYHALLSLSLNKKSEISLLVREKTLEKN